MAHQFLKQTVLARLQEDALSLAPHLFRIIDPERAIIQAEDFLMATSQLAQTTLRSVLNKHELEEMLAERDRLNNDVPEIRDAQIATWGIKVANVEIKQVDITETMMRANGGPRSSMPKVNGRRCSNCGRQPPFWASAPKRCNYVIWDR
jgi:regulator of protease activity HflC (stomatin/prohibitin superfamily)